MKYLLDTHILFWSMDNEDKLPKSILEILNDPNNDIYFSSASVWEVVIKHNKHPENMPISGEEFVEGCLKAGYISLPIENNHVMLLADLKRKTEEPPHNDPFDRILIALAKAESMTFITRDSMLSGYLETTVMKI